MHIWKQLFLESETCFHTQVREHENQILSPCPFSLRYHSVEAHVQYMQKKVCKALPEIDVFPCRRQTTPSCYYKQRHLLICHTQLRLLCNHACEFIYYQSIKKADRWKNDENRVVFICQVGEIHGSKQEATIEGILLPTLCRQKWFGIM